MPDASRVREVMIAAGFQEAKTDPPTAGQAARNHPVFRIHTLSVERRFLYVFHVGMGNQIEVSKYERALVAAGYIVTHAREGLKVSNARNPVQTRRAVDFGP